MQPVLVLALIAVLLLLLVAVGAIGFLAYRLATDRARHLAAAEAARRSAEQAQATALAARSQALEAQLVAVRQAAESQAEQARAALETVKREAADYVLTELQTRTLALQQAAQAQLQVWREQELSAARQQQVAVAQGEAQTDLAQWKVAHEEAIRQDAIDRSRAVIAGKITEHFVPYLPDFPFNPKDARFIGSPVDLVVFDGLDEGAVRRVVLIEVKTGSSALSARERRVRDAVLSGHVEWLELRPKLDFTATLTPALDGASVDIQLNLPSALLTPPQPAAQ
jgi:predicted Holliday junction resolvase-like endonuclease